LLAKLAPTDRQALYRYYVDTETEEQICSELNITPTHFHAMRRTTKAAVRSRLREFIREPDRS
jgi:hypothetical protein